MQPRSVHAKNLSLAIDQRPAGEAGIHCEIGTDELINFTAAPRAHGPCDQAGENSGTGDDVAAPRARQSKHQFAYAEIGRRSPADGWRINRLLQTQDDKVSAGIASADAGGKLLSGRGDHDDL